MEGFGSKLLRRTLQAACALLWLWPSAAAAVGVGEKAPGFRLPALGAGGDVSLAEHRGKVVYLDFWASWCPPCLSSIPQLEGLRKEFPAGDFQILAINIDRDPAKALAFLAKHSVGYPSGSDPKGEWPKRFDIPTMPTSFLIDAEGVVRHVHPGFRDGDLDALRQRIRQMLGAKGR